MYIEILYWYQINETDFFVLTKRMMQYQALIFITIHI